MNPHFKFSDEIVAAIAKLLQLAILTGTDISDWFRMIEVCPATDGSGLLVLSDAYREMLDKQIDSLEELAEKEAERIMNEEEGDEDESDDHGGSSLSN